MKKKYRDFLKKAKESPVYWEEVLILELTEDIWKLMQEKKLSQRKLAKKLGTSEAYISKVLNGSENLSIKSIVKLALALNAAPHIHVAPKDLVVEWKEREPFSSSTDVSVQADVLPVGNYEFCSWDICEDEVGAKRFYPESGVIPREADSVRNWQIH